jgi:hypothetical protein
MNQLFTIVVFLLVFSYCSKDHTNNVTTKDVCSPIVETKTVYVPKVVYKDRVQYVKVNNYASDIAEINQMVKSLRRNAGKP